MEEIHAAIVGDLTEILGYAKTHTKEETITLLENFLKEITDAGPEKTN